MPCLVTRQLFSLSLDMTSSQASTVNRWLASMLTHPFRLDLGIRMHISMSRPERCIDVAGYPCLSPNLVAPGCLRNNRHHNLLSTRYVVLVYSDVMLCLRVLTRAGLPDTSIWQGWLHTSWAAGCLSSALSADGPFQISPAPPPSGLLSSHPQLLLLCLMQHAIARL